MKIHGYHNGICNIPQIEKYLKEIGFDCNDGEECIIGLKPEIWSLVKEYMDTNSCKLKIPETKMIPILSKLSEIVESKCCCAEHCGAATIACTASDRVNCQPVRRTA